MTSTCVFPSQIVSPPSLRSEELLLLCYYDPQGISTVPETVAFMQDFSRFSVTVLNMFEHGRNNEVISISPKINLRKFDALIIHNSLSYSVDNLRSLDRDLEFKISDFSGVKVLMKQDENFKFSELATYIGETQFDLIYTCLPTEAIPLIYPASVVGKVTFVRMLTGYITPTLRNISINKDLRSIDVGYRGSIQPLNFGRLAFEKRKIGEDFVRLEETKELALNISSRWEDRLGHASWLEFLGSCKATLGVESGASIFDLDDNLADRCAAAEKKHGPIREDIEYAELFLAELADLEGKIKYNQVSPRHFEAAATRTLQIMYPGEYSGIFQKGRHYLELARDYSNVNQILEILRNEEKYKQVIDCAYDEIINNKEYWIETFVKRFDQQISRLLIKKGLYTSPELILGRKKKNILLLCAHKPSIDPRLNWISKCAPSKLNVTQIGILPSGSEDACVEHLEHGRLVLTEPTITFQPNMLRYWMASKSNNPAGWAGVSEISYMASALTLEHSIFLEQFGAPAGGERVETFKWYLNFILNATATLVSQVDRITGYSALIATDLHTLPAALIIKGFTGVPIVYDAHEYMPESDVLNFEFEKKFWIEMERRLVQWVDHCQTVSPGLANLMSEQYGRQFNVVPNCEPITSVVYSLTKCKSGATCRFIYLGNFAPKRGIDILIDAWVNTEVDAILILRGPDNEYKKSLIDRAFKTGLLGTRIQFLAPVDEGQLVTTAQEYDVGLIPYTPYGANYTFCCPNKMSQYMAAGIPILANNTSYVKDVIESSNAGVVIDFTKTHEIIKAVSWFVSHQDLRQDMGYRASLYFRNEFNWNKLSAFMYETLTKLVDCKANTALRVFPIRERKPLYAYISPVDLSFLKTNNEKHIKIVKKIWRLLPTNLRYKFGSKLTDIFRIRFS